MNYASPLPPYLARRYHSWKSTEYAENQAWFRRLGEEGQHPRAMVISCCDSRVNVISLFEAESGELFIHRNIANLVPAYSPDGEQRATSSTIEYAVSVLKVAHLIVLGHSGCGGVAGCIKMCSGDAPELERPESFVGRWLDILRPSCAATEAMADPAERQQSVEKRAVLVSLANLMTFPFVACEVEQGRLSLHGLWTEISTGALEFFDPQFNGFRRI